ncbi:MAG: hypothetical protein AAFO69_08245 [Bacteroidota bacterium]
MLIFTGYQSNLISSFIRHREKIKINPLKLDFFSKNPMEQYRYNSRCREKSIIAVAGIKPMADSAGPIN